jgi:hypothetical protein
VGAISGQVNVETADPALWADLPVLPVNQQSAEFAVADSLRSVMQTPHPGWTWTGPLSGLSGWPVALRHRAVNRPRGCVGGEFRTNSKGAIFTEDIPAERPFG